VNVPHLLKLLGWNKRVLTYEDFEGACEHQGILIQRTPTKTLGMYFHCGEVPVISLSVTLQGILLWLVAWHEFTHHLLHPPGIRCFNRGTVSKAEAEAQDIALVSVLDERSFLKIVGGELHDVPTDILRQRMRVAYQRHW
jgi:hypothetical protein